MIYKNNTIRFLKKLKYNISLKKVIYSEIGVIFGFSVFAKPLFFIFSMSEIIKRYSVIKFSVVHFIVVRIGFLDINCLAPISEIKS